MNEFRLFAHGREFDVDAFLAAIQGQRPPDRPLAHEILVQETLLRATGRIASS